MVQQSRYDYVFKDTLRGNNRHIFAGNNRSDKHRPEGTFMCQRCRRDLPIDKIGKSYQNGDSHACKECVENLEEFIQQERQRYMEHIEKTGEKY